MDGVAFFITTPALPRSGWSGWLVPRLALAFNAAMRESASSAAGSAPSLDDLLVAVGRDRDRTAFAALFDHFAPRLKAYLRRLGAEPGTAEELVQEIMLLVWRRAETFDPVQSSAGTWVFTIARNRRIDALRREQRPDLDPDDPALVPEPALPADHAVAAAEGARRLRAALRDLPPEQVELLQLAYYEDMPHSAISSERGIPLGTVKSRLRLALERLRRTLGDDA